MMWGYGGWGMIFMGLFWLGVVALVIWGIRSKGHARDSQDLSTHAMEILEQRYARGEIDTDEFRERREALEG
jgi:putative membrane protein